MKNTVEVKAVREVLLNEADYQFNSIGDYSSAMETYRHICSLVWVLRETTGHSDEDGIERQMHELMNKCLEKARELSR